MAGTFLSICFALCAVALDAMHTQVGIHRHGAGEKACHELLVSKVRQIDLHNVSAIEFLTVADVLPDFEAKANEVIDAIEKGTYPPFLQTFLDSKLEPKAFNQCGTSDFQEPGSKLVHAFKSAACAKGSKTEQYVLSEEFANVNPQAGVKTVLGHLKNGIKEGGLERAGLKQFFPAETLDACHNFDFNKFLNIGAVTQMKKCLHSMMDFVSVSGPCTSCFTEYLHDVLGSKLANAPYACLEVCYIIQQVRSARHDPLDLEGSKICTGCSTAAVNKWGRCAKGINWITDLPKEFVSLGLLNA